MERFGHSGQNETELTTLSKSVFYIMVAAVIVVVVQK
jgi:hypothetical protein